MSEFSRDLNLTYDQLCGVPYTALPIATLMSVGESKPMLIRRKEAKSYGTKKLIEGKFSAGESCLIVEDIITSGSSILETVADLRAVGIAVTDAVVVVDREQGAVANTATKQVRTHALFTLSQLLGVLRDAGKIDQSIVESVSQYIRDSQVPAAVEKPLPPMNRLTATYEARAAVATNAVARRLFTVMATKRTNLCVAADLRSTQAILDMADAIGPHICVLKTHVDIVDDFRPEFVQALKQLATKHNFLLMEDRKFADIGNTVALQYGAGPFRIVEWADLVTAHSLAGAAMLRGLESVMSDGVDRGVFLLAELSSDGALTTAAYAEETMRVATGGEASGCVTGIVCQTGALVRSAGLIQLTPGCRIGESGDELGQRYDTPDYVVREKGADIAVVGRGVVQAKCVESAAKMYREQLWQAYEKRVAAAAETAEK